MKIYTGAPSAARHYVEAGRGRTDDYYLTEGTGIARSYSTRGGRVTELAALAGDGYEAWVAGLDPATGAARGRLRTDERAVRFVEIVVNGPKSWSLAAALHPDVAAAYDAAQDRAATQVIGWLAEHATTRVGPRGGQVQVPVERLEAVTVRHHTSRAGDPHRHLHLQVNARVFAAGRWRGLHTVGVRDFLAAINGIGHAAVVSDPQFRSALAAHGYTLDGTGEVLELAGYVGAFSARAAQIGRNLDRYEHEWTAAHPGQIPGPALRRAWDARAWAEGRPDKVTPQPGADLTARWMAELTALGYRDRDHPVDLVPTPVGTIDRDDAVGTVLTRLAAGRSAWNAADVRGQVEQLIAAEGIIADAAVRLELAEDLTARAMARCVPLLDRAGVPEHLRAWTSQPVLDVEDDLTARFAARSAPSPADPQPGPEPVLPLPLSALARLDPGQAAAAASLAGDRPLILIEGAAGAGKTTMLAAARAQLAAQGRRLTVVTPTLKAANVAAAEVGTATGSAAWLAYQHGWRWSTHGAWTRLAAGTTDPLTEAVYAGPAQAARMRAGDLLVVDEAGMLDQDTARALLTIADEAGIRLALLGDRHQLAAVGRGGVLDLAVGQVDPAAHLTLDAVHRFVRTDQTGQTVPDTEYAELTLAMRIGADPADVFDTLVARGRIRLHPDPVALHESLAATAATSYSFGEQVAVVVDSREQTADLDAAIRERLVAENRVDDTRVAITRSGQRIGVGDRITTRRNDRRLGVANRDTWTVTALGRDGRLTVTPTAGDVTPAGVTPSIRERVLPADYVTSHVELAYASTAHGVQGDTVATAHVVVGEHTGAASAYVGMTRGRTANTAHLVAEDLAEARQQWIAVFSRNRADLGPGHAAQMAAAEAAHYAAPRPLQEVLADLREAWTAEQRCLTRLALLQPMRDRLAEIVPIHTGHADQIAALQAGRRTSAVAANQATQQVEASGRAVTAHAERIRADLLGRWDSERDAARAAARVVLDGPGRLRLRRAAVTHASGQLADWADRWRPHLRQLPGDPGRLAQLADRSDDRPALATAFGAAARRAAEHAHSEHAVLRAAADAARCEHEQAGHALAEAERRRDDELGWFGALGPTPDPAGRLADLDRDIAADQHGLAAARARIAQLQDLPALAGQPAQRLAAERDAWRAARDAERHLVRSSSRRPVASAVDIGGPQLWHHHGRSAGNRGAGPPLGR
ncbi:conjugative relaxase domain-containing protein, TrwC/TraI family [Geodermatophilus obscurus]|uniref:Conjugative relaxase domain-containing protein, TrwC/TraI family n=1 Tax=Geodermatophilus obscurus TaxID=1861 RepID=A0A1M7V029_9ACTN|nr:MobF family relaxase [Geodermatophilus obscurus]SHN88520.1 conjugative relaxase domain-containing protein, TrwC/TraI family [Geodermatophilus obscurus]